VAEFAAEALQHAEFIPGETPVPVSGRVLRPADLVALVDSSLDGWLTAGPHTEEFERQLARYVGVRSALFVNSGSSANLAAFSALTSAKLGKKALRPGDEVITAAMGFPTTVNPIIQNGLVPVLVDSSLPTYNPTLESLKNAWTPKTRAVVLAHTLGNPFQAQEIRQWCDDNEMWLLEDNCDGLGSLYRGQRTGSFGHVATQSFYPAHHITTGEGGAVLVDSPLLKRQVESFRDWGRDCYCAPGEDNTCLKRFEWTLGTLPPGYDHKYTYSHIGYNLKGTDMQAALGVTQLAALEGFIAARRRNFDHLLGRLRGVPELLLPEATAGSEPSWFGLALTINPETDVSRDDLLKFLSDRKIGTRLLFAGNISRQPAYRDINFRIPGPLDTADLVTRSGFWLGVYPGLSEEMLDFVADSVLEFLAMPPEPVSE
jgi:CDP-6-deoxy-D-xylo-4-hexulose-3-dehydrase